MKYAIVTPTYPDHFKFIRPYLRSYDKHVIDKDEVSLYFVISRAEQESFKNIVSPYSKIKMRILCFEDILEHFAIEDGSEELLRKYGRYTFQTLKKFYTLLFIPEERSLVLDCESMWVRETSMQQVFSDFFANPKIYGSKFADREKVSPFFSQIARNIDYLLGDYCPYWFIENYMWFYEKRILEALCEERGSPMQLAEAILRPHTRLTQFVQFYTAIFEIILYQNFLFFNRERFGYKLVDVYDEMQKYLRPSELKAYLKQFIERYKGSCGIVEHVCLLLNRSNTTDFIRMFKKLDIQIIRINETTNVKTYKCQRRFLRGLRPAILAASQNHAFGVNSRFGLVAEDWGKFKRHLRNIVLLRIRCNQLGREICEIVSTGIKVFTTLIKLISL